MSSFNDLKSSKTYKLNLGNNAMTGVIKKVYIEQDFKTLSEIKKFKNLDDNPHYDCGRGTSTKFWPGHICV